MNGDEPLIRARGLVKRFGPLTAVDGIDVDVWKGEAFGFLGPNGAGKSSTMRMIGCVSPPSDGELTIMGMDPRRDGPAIRARLGVCPQEDTLDVELNTRENLTTYARYFGIPRRVARQRADELLAFVQLDGRADSKVEPLSGGMKRRLSIARALVNEPEIMMLDEPTTGLDPQARHLVWDRLFRLKQRGVTLVLTTHYMDEAEQLCDRLVVMDGGRIVAEGSPQALIETHATREVVELRFGAAGQASEASQAEPNLHHSGVEALAAYAGKLDGVGERVEVLPDRILLYTGDGDATVREVAARELNPSGVLVRRGSLEDVFLHLTGRSLVED
jgi:lipooligosaccharide transport system ATP-binding protein